MGPISSKVFQVSCMGVESAIGVLNSGDSSDMISGCSKESGSSGTLGDEWRAVGSQDKSAREALLGWCSVDVHLGFVPNRRFGHGFGMEYLDSTTTRGLLPFLGYCLFGWMSPTAGLNFYFDFAGLH